MTTIFNDTYEIKSMIGKGGMSTVYLAEHKRLHTDFAIKEVRKQQWEKFDFLAEVNILKRLNHPMLPHIADIFEDENCIYIVEEYVAGMTLEAFLKQEKRVDEAQGLQWFRELCSVLQYLHGQPRPIIYRDMKPSNIMLQPDGTLKLIDFGIAREYKQSSHADTSYIGTREYAAPEQLGGKEQTDARTDIYSLGVTMYHLLTGKAPYEPPYGFVPVRKLVPELSPRIETILNKCVQLEPQDRYQTVNQLLSDLQRVNHDDRKQKPPKEPSQKHPLKQKKVHPPKQKSKQEKPQEPKRKNFHNRRRTWMIPIAAMLALSIALMAGGRMLIGSEGENAEKQELSSQTTPDTLKQQEVPAPSTTPETPDNSEEPIEPVANISMTVYKQADIDALALRNDKEQIAEVVKYVNSYSIKDISALSNLTNLKELNLSKNSISDISALSGLTRLTVLNFGKNRIIDISALSRLTNLTYLDLGGNAIRDISALNGLNSLEVLYLGKNRIRDISALSNLTNLTELRLQYNDISDISALSSLTNLTQLYLNNNDISDIHELGALQNLKRLGLSGNDLSQQQVDALQALLPNCTIIF